MEKLIRAVFVLTLLATPFSTSRDSALGGVVSFAIPLLGLFAGLYLAMLSFRGRLVLLPRARTLVVIAVTYALFVNFMALFSADVVASLSRAFVNVLGLPLLLFVVGADVRDEARQSARSQLVRRALVASGALLALYFLGNIALQMSRFGPAIVLSERHVGGLMELPWGASNVVASVLLFPTFVAGLEWSVESRRGRLLSGIAIALMVSAMALTFSRTVLGALLAGFVLYNVVHNGFKGMLKVATVPVIAAVLVGAAGVYFFGGEIMEDIFRNRTDDSNLRRLGGRNEVWSATLEYVRQNPFSPVGYFGSIYDIGFSGHNLILTTYVEMGGVGVILTVGVFAAVVYLLIRARRSPWVRQPAMILLAMWGAYLLNVQFEDVLYAPPSIVYFWTCLGISAGIERAARKDWSPPTVSLSHRLA